MYCTLYFEGFGVLRNTKIVSPDTLISKHLHKLIMMFQLNFTDEV